MLSEEHVSYPYELYARLYTEPSACQIRQPNGLDAWHVVRYDDLKAVLNDRRVSNDPRHAEDELRRAGVIHGDQMITGHSMPYCDPPDHTRLRGLVASAFTIRRVRDLQPRVQAIADELIDGFESKGEADLIPAFAVPLATTVMGELLGVPRTDWEAWRAWSTATLRSATNDQQREHQRECMQAIQRYLVQLVASKRGGSSAYTPDQAPDLLSGLVAARDQQSRLSEQELLGTANLLLIAGQETTVNLIGNGILALLRHPEQLALLERQPELVEPAVEEMLRYDPPVQHGSYRIALADVELDGMTIPAGSIVSPMFGAAGHDPDHVDGADRFDITRADRPHLSFGYGIHACLGAQLGRMEARVGIGTLVRRCGDLSLACSIAEVRWRRSYAIRALEALPVTFTPRGRDS